MGESPRQRDRKRKDESMLLCVQSSLQAGGFRDTQGDMGPLRRLMDGSPYCHSLLNVPSVSSRMLSNLRASRIVTSSGLRSLRSGFLALPVCPVPSSPTSSPGEVRAVAYFQSGWETLPVRSEFSLCGSTKPWKVSLFTSKMVSSGP